MAYPTGSGSERLHRGMMDNQATSATAFTWDGTQPAVGNASATVPAHHIISLINFSVTEMANQNGKKWWIWLDLSGTEIKFNQNVGLNARQTFAWDDRIVLHPGDILKIEATASSNFDIFYSYIDQDWT